MDQHAGSPCHSTYYYAELAASFINFPYYCLPSSGFYGAGKDNGADALTIRLDATPSRLLVPPLPSFPHFYAECRFCCNPPNLSWLGTGIK